MQPDRDVVATITPSPGSFARSVLEQRHPAILEQVRSTHPYGPGQLARLERLLDDTLHGVVDLPPDPVTEGPDAARRWPDRADWEAWVGSYRGRSVFEVPFLVAEGWFYRRLLDAVAFVEPGPWQGVDPFAPMKAAELRALASVPAGSPDREALLLASVWGNQADLGFQLVAGDSARRRGELVVDDSERFFAVFDGGGLDVAWVCDNAGRELAADLLLVDRLLADGSADTVTLHLKPRPHYVSDATAGDLADCLEALDRAGAREQAARLRTAAGAGSLAVAADPFWCSPLELGSAPAGLAERLAAADLVVVKGDLNYRRLVGDAAWPPCTPFGDVVQLAGRVAALRTLKSDVVVGLPEGLAERLDGTAPGWRTNGSHAVVQVAG